MDKRSFLDLLDRYQKDNCTKEEKLKVDRWFSSLHDTEQQELSPEEVSMISSRIWSSLPHHKDIPLAKQRRISWLKLPAAAAVLALVFWAGLTLVNRNYAERSFRNENAGEQFLSKTNTSDQIQTLELSDHSVVSLQPAASITYPKNFTGNKRPVYLKGNAFFSVTKNPAKPFYVYNDRVVVRVVGTSFLVRSARGNTAAQVDVRTGKVQVKENLKQNFISSFLPKRSKSVYVTPNQKAVFDEDHHQLSTTLVDHPVVLTVPQNAAVLPQFKFSETSLKDILNLLSLAYGIQINVEDKGIYECTFTGDIDQKDLYEQLNLICQSISGSYRIEGTAILISGKKCN